MHRACRGCRSWCCDTRPGEPIEPQTPHSGVCAAVHLGVRAAVCSNRGGVQFSRGTVVWQSRHRTARHPCTHLEAVLLGLAPAVEGVALREPRHDHGMTTAPGSRHRVRRDPRPRCWQAQARRVRLRTCRHIHRSGGNAAHLLHLTVALATRVCAAPSSTTGAQGGSETNGRGVNPRPARPGTSPQPGSHGQCLVNRQARHTLRDCTGRTYHQLVRGHEALQRADVHRLGVLTPHKIHGGKLHGLEQPTTVLAVQPVQQRSKVAANVKRATGGGQAWCGSHRRRPGLCTKHGRCSNARRSKAPPTQHANLPNGHPQQARWQGEFPKTRA